MPGILENELKVMSVFLLATAWECRYPLGHGCLISESDTHSPLQVLNWIPLSKKVFKQSNVLGGVYMKVRATARSSWLSYFTVCPMDETQVVSHDNKHYYTLSQVIVPQENIFE